jgi:hypothetical protein
MDVFEGMRLFIVKLDMVCGRKGSNNAAQRPLKGLNAPFDIGGTFAFVS